MPDLRHCYWESWGMWRSFLLEMFRFVYGRVGHSQCRKSGAFLALWLSLLVSCAGLPALLLCCVHAFLVVVICLNIYFSSLWCVIESNLIAWIAQEIDMKIMYATRCTDHVGLPHTSRSRRLRQSTRRCCLLVIYVSRLTANRTGYFFRRSPSKLGLLVTLRR